MLIRIAIASLLMSLMPAAYAADVDTHYASVGGKVTDREHHAVVGARVILKERDTSSEFVAKTDRDGDFTIKHPYCGSCSLQIIAPPKSALAQAVLQDIPGEDNRHLLISLKPGFRITGQIVSGGKPLKNVTVRLMDQHSDTVHGGGETTTDGHGTFALTVTPGTKILEVLNSTQQKASGLHREKCHVTADEQLPAIDVPANTAIGSLQ